MVSGSRASEGLRVCLGCASDHWARVKQEAGEHGVGVEDGLRGEELQQGQAPDASLLYDLRLLAIEILGGQKLRELAVEVELLVDQRQLLVKLLELREPEISMEFNLVVTLLGQDYGLTIDIAVFSVGETQVARS